MFNYFEKRKVLSTLDKSHKVYENLAEQVNKRAMQLADIRQEACEFTTQRVEDFINQLANSPKELNKSFGEYKARFEDFDRFIALLNNASSTVDALSVAGVVSSAAIGGVSIAAQRAATAALARSSTAIATTFMTGSSSATMTALSSATATNAAVLHLSSGALVNGISSKAVAAAGLGPIGLVISGLILTATSIYTYSKNKEVIEEALGKTREIETFNSALTSSLKEIDSLIHTTNYHTSKVEELLARLEQIPTRDYKQFTDEQRELVGTLKNSIEALSLLLHKKVGEK